MVAWRAAGITVRSAWSLRPLAGPARARHEVGKGMLHQATHQDYAFGPWPIHASEVFLATPLSFAFVNLKPIVPGHVLVSPVRVVQRFAELTPEEVADLWSVAKRVGSVVEAEFRAASLTFAIQDGPAAGQTVPHVHVHILPRRPGDFEPNDKVYDELDAASKELVKELPLRDDAGIKVDAETERKPRTAAEMAEEAASLRGLF